LGLTSISPFFQQSSLPMRWRFCQSAVAPGESSPELSGRIIYLVVIATTVSIKPSEGVHGCAELGVDTGGAASSIFDFFGCQFASTGTA
jgi:hypothetical protein